VTCPAPGALVEKGIDRLGTKYREATKLNAYLRTHLEQIDALIIDLCGLPEQFDLDTAVGDQLTIIGKWLGYPRRHPHGRLRPVFGFEPEPSEGILITPVVGFDDNPWDDADGPRFLPYLFEDDDLFRIHLRLRVMQVTHQFAQADLLAAIRSLWGEDAYVLEGFQPGTVIVAPNRILTSEEQAMLPVSVGVLPIVPGMKRAVYLELSVPFGFKTGWGPFDSPWLIAQEVPR
jgi:hypothetical protein